MINGMGRALIDDFDPDSVEQGCSATYMAEHGVVQYSAPELNQRGSVLYSNEVDIFSFGSLLYTILVPSQAFGSRRIQPGNRDGEMPRIPDSCGSLMQQLIAKCWSMDPESRPSFDDILNDFRDHSFALIPGANASLVREYVCGVLLWESKCAESHQ
jgi:hypothetical protein